MREIRTSGLMSGDGKRGGASRQCSRPSSTLPTSIVSDYFEAFGRGKCRRLNVGSRESRCSVDLPSCKQVRAMTRSAQNVFAAEPPWQGWQGTYLLVSGGDGAHAGRP